MTPLRLKVLALCIGVLSHALFVLAVGLMAHALFYGFSQQFFQPHWSFPLLINLALIVQFPLLHSLLLRKGNGAAITVWLPQPIRADMRTTMYALVASIQLLAVFLLWQPLGSTVLSFSGVLFAIHVLLYGAAWVVLGVAIINGGAHVQTGYIGWSSVVRGVKPQYPGMPQRGLFKVCRQPIYLGFFLVLITGPYWTLDHLLFALVWGAYCYGAPYFKEQRFRQWFGNEFEEYQKSVPYFFPHLLWRRKR
jgi:protein-S-isoprenylcysteine O-methyltransferase Ste14